MTSAKRHHKSAFAAARHTKGLHIVALFEGAKGVLVLLAGFGLLALIHKDIHEIAARLIVNFHFNPAATIHGSSSTCWNVSMTIICGQWLGRHCSTRQLDWQKRSACG